MSRTDDIRKAIGDAPKDSDLVTRLREDYDLADRHEAAEVIENLERALKVRTDQVDRLHAKNTLNEETIALQQRRIRKQSDQIDQGEKHGRVFLNDTDVKPDAPKDSDRVNRLSEQDELDALQQKDDMIGILERALTAHEKEISRLNNGRLLNEGTIELQQRDIRIKKGDIDAMKAKVAVMNGTIDAMKATIVALTSDDPVVQILVVA